MNKIKFEVNAVTWFDKAGGNTYHSVRVTRTKDGATLYCPFTYGYGDHYRQTALEAMARAKWLPPKYRERHANGTTAAYLYERENDYPINWTVSEGPEKACIANGKEG